METGKRRTQVEKHQTLTGIMTWSGDPADITVQLPVLSFDCLVSEFIQLSSEMYNITVRRYNRCKSCFVLRYKYSTVQKS